MTASEVIAIVQLLFSLIGAGLGAFGAYTAKKTRVDVGLADNLDDIVIMKARLDRMDIAGEELEKSGEQVRIRLVGISGDNGLVHDIIRLKDQVADLRISVEVVADRLNVKIAKDPKA